MWTLCAQGHDHWGRLGAAGLLLTDPERTGVVLQKWAPGVHQGGTWGVPGGAIDRGETTIEAALREADEEAGIDPSSLTVVREIVGTDHGDWTYTCVLAETDRTEEPFWSGWEAEATLWVDLEDVSGLRLHPGLRADWPRLRGRLRTIATPA